MAHQNAYNRSATGHMFAHYDRTGKNISNPDLDPSRSHLNYNLSAETQPLKQTDFLREALSQPDVFCMNRPNVNVITDWVFQVPKDLPEEEWKQFFQCCREFTLKRYFGEDEELWKKFEISCYAHFDEYLKDDKGNLTEEHGAPHIHFCFIPALWDSKKNRWKVCHKELVTRTDLKSFHDDLAVYLEAEMGHPVHVHEHNTESKGALTVTKLKLHTAEKELAEANKAKEEALQQKAETEKENADLKAKNEDLRVENKGLKKENKATRKKLTRAETMLKQVQSQQKIRKGESIPDYEVVGLITKYARYTEDDNKTIRSMASNYQADRDAEKPLIGTELEETLEKALDANKRLYATLEEKDLEGRGKDKKISEQSEEIDRLNSRIATLESGVKDLIKALGKVKDLLPEQVQNLAKQAQELVFPPRQQERTRNITKDRGISR